MYEKIGAKGNWYLTDIKSSHTGGFVAYVENSNDGKTKEVRYSSITEKFYGARIPNYVKDYLISEAKSKGIEVSFYSEIGL